MNRYRLNQIMELLLFPFIDPALAEKDYLLSCYQAYHSFMEESRKVLSGVGEGNRRDREYKGEKKKLIDYLVQRNQGSVKSKDDIQMLCDYFYPMVEIERSMEQIKIIQKSKGCSWFEEESISSYYIKSMSRISHSLITYRDGVATIRQWVDEKDRRTKSDIFSSATVFNKVEIWNLLCRIMVPDIFIAIAAVENGMGIEALYEQKTNLALADKLLMKSINKGVAENHLHFNAGFDYDVIWLSYMNLDFVEEIEFAKCSRAEYTRLEMALFRYVAALYFTEAKPRQDFGNWMRNNLPDEVLDVIGKLYRGIYDDRPGRQIRAAVHSIRGNIKSRNITYKYDYLLNDVYREYAEYKTSSEFILLYQSYRYIKENCEDTFYARLFIQYLRLKNEYFSRSLQSHVMQGLRYFQEAYDSAKQNAYGAIPQEELMVEAFRSQARITHLKKLEIRIAPDVNGLELDMLHYHKSRRSIMQQLYNQIYQVFSAYRRYILESIIGVIATRELLRMERRDLEQRENREYILEKVRKSKVNIPALGIVFHFLKTEHLEDRAGSYCWRKVLDGKEHHSSYRMYKRMYVTNIALAMEEIRETIPGINEYIVGIDAASDENAMEPWMFVPAYKVMRSHEHTKPVMEVDRDEKFDRIQNIGFTYHVGEDFRHIVSGLRHVDEVLEEFGYKAGDRLGHALVLGTDVEQWTRENEAVPMPLLEHLENLLWMWGKNTCDGLELPIQLEVLEDEIMNLAEELYEFPETITVKMLYIAYKKKFEPNHEKIVRKLLDSMEKTGHPECYYCEAGSQCYNGWTADKLLATNYCPVFEERYGRVELIPVSGDDVAVYKKLQEYLICKVEQKGIYIEANPTSNLTIGDFAHMHQHPIFKLNKRVGEQGHHVFVTINSDDPAVFSTNVENELAYIYYAAEANGASKSEILEWVDRIRQYGMDASFIQREKSAEQTLTEIEDIMRAIAHVEF